MQHIKPSQFSLEPVYFGVFLFGRSRWFGASDKETLASFHIVARDCPRLWTEQPRLHFGRFGFRVEMIALFPV